VAGKALTQRPRRNSVPSVLEALRHREHGENWLRQASPVPEARMFMKTQPLSEESMVAAINQVSENKEVNETFAGSCKKRGI
jgi:tRNA(Ser,Leu) C12 N-acetylase TAN1